MSKNTAVNSSLAQQNVSYHPSTPWLIWTTSLVFVLFQFLVQLSSGVIVKQLMVSFAISGLSAGILTGSYYYVYTSLQIPAGMLIDTFGPRHLLSFGAAILGVGSMLFGITHSFYLAVLARLAMGGGAAFAFLGSLYLIREWFAVERYAVMVGFAETLGMIGAIVGTIGLAALLSHFGWRHCMIGAGIFSLLCGIACWAIIRNKNPLKQHLHVAVPHTPFVTSLALVMRDKVAWFNGLYNCMVFSVVIVFAALWAIPYFQLALNCSLTFASSLVTLIFLGSAIGCPLLGKLSEIFHSRRPFLLFGALSSALLISIIIYVPSNFMVEGILLLLLGVCCGSYILAFAISDDIAPPHMKNTYAGFTNAIGMIGAPLFQPVVGWLLDIQTTKNIGGYYTLAEYHRAFLILPVILLIAALIAFVMPETHPKFARPH